MKQFLDKLPKKKLLTQSILVMQLACTHPAHHFGTDTTLLVSHTNTPEKCCPDGNASMLIIQSMAHYIIENINHQAKFHACFSKPNPPLGAIIDKFKGVKAVYFYDLHPNMSHYALDPTHVHVYDHHLTSLDMDTNSGPFADLSKQQIKAVLSKVSGTHLAAYHFMHLIFQYYKTTDKQFAELKNEFNKEEPALQAIHSFDYMRKLVPIVAEDSHISTDAPIKKLLTLNRLNLLENIGLTDLYSLGGGKQLPAFNSIDLGCNTLSILLTDTLDKIKQKLITCPTITRESITMNIYDLLFKARSTFKRDGGEAMVDKATLTHMLQNLDKIELTPETQVNLGQHLLKKYDLFVLMRGVGPSLLPPMRYLTEKVSLDDEAVELIYFPFSPSSGCAEDEVLDLFKFTDKEKGQLKQATDGGTLREIESYIQEVIAPSESGPKQLCILEGATSVSFRANFDMIDYDFEHNKVINHLQQLGINGGGHPRAAGCSKTDPGFLQFKAQVLKNKVRLPFP